MFVYINDYGYKASKRDQFLVVEHPSGEKEEYLISDLHAVYFAGEGRISKAIILELTHRNVDILMLSERGKPMIYVYPTSTKPKMWDLWKRQTLLDPRKKVLPVRRFVLKAISAKAKLLTELAKSRKITSKETATGLINYRNRIRGVENKVKGVKPEWFKDFRNVMMGWEGFSAKLYFESLKHVIPKEVGYEGLRRRRPPGDLFNAAISFGYSYLKYLVERELIFFGASPYYGILHQENDKVYQFLVFDLMEGFRHSFVDRIVIGLISKKILQKRHSRKFSSGVYLNKYGQGTLSNALYKERTKVDKLISGDIKYSIKVIINESMIQFIVMMCYSENTNSQ